MTKRPAHSPCDWVVVGHVFVLLLRRGHIDHERWEHANGAIHHRAITHMLVLSWGDIDVTSTQRKFMAENVRRRRLSVLAVSDSALTRGMITVAAWMGVQIKPYHWAEIEHVLADLPSSPAQKEQLRDIVAQFRKSCVED